MPENFPLITEQGDEHMDLSGLACPMPLLKIKQRLSMLKKGSVISVKTTDQGSVRDFNSYLNLSKHVLVAQELNEEDGEYFFLIRCGGSS